MSSCFRLSTWTTVGRTKSPSPESLPLWRHIHHLVSLRPSLPTLIPVLGSTLTTPQTGLQTPRLKRLAEIVSQQAIAQQEKLEYGSEMGDEGEDEGGYDDGQSAGDMTQVDQTEQAERASQASRPTSMAAASAA